MENKPFIPSPPEGEGEGEGEGDHPLFTPTSILPPQRGRIRPGTFSLFEDVIPVMKN